MKNKLSLVMRIFVLFIIAGTGIAPSAAAQDVGRSSDPFSSDNSSISGKVIDLSGHPVQGVTITATSCDLSKQPVLLIHGWGGPDVMADDEMGFAQLSQWMQTNGYVEGCNLFYAANVSSNNTNDQNRQAISDNLRNALVKLGAGNPRRGHFDIIGHSYGGLNARFYLESSYYQADQNYRPYGFGIQVDNLFTLGTPHGGVVLPDEFYPGAAYIFYEQVFTPWDFANFLSAAQLHVSMMDAYNSSHRQPVNTCYRLLGGDFLQQDKVPTDVSKLYALWSNKPGDIGVSLRSSCQLGINQDLSGNYPNVIVHTNKDMHGYFPPKEILGMYQLDLSGLNSYVRPDASYNTYIRDNLGAPISECHLSGAVASLEQSSENSDFVPPIVIANGQLTTSEPVTHTLSIDWTGESTFYVSWNEGNLDFNLVDPSNTHINPEAAITDPNADYGSLSLGESSLATYVFTTTVPGEWKFVVTNATGPYPVNYSISANPDSVLKADVYLPEQQDLDTPVVITATLTAAAVPVPGSTVNATIAKPDKSQEQLSLVDNGVSPDIIPGDGVYSAVFNETSQAGFYNVFISASGAYNSNPFVRTTQGVFSIKPKMASFTHSISDQGVDTDGNGLFDYLEVQVGVLVTETGRLSLSAELQGSGGQLIDQTSVISDVTSTGEKAVSLRFSGERIWSLKMDGPYTVTQSSLMDDDTFILLDTDWGEYPTSIYDYLQFNLGRPVYLPVVLRLTDAGSPANLVSMANAITQASYSAVTDSSGNYVLSGLPDGQYTIIPSQSGYSFSPPWRTLDLPPNTTSQNFTRQSGIPPGAMVLVPAGNFNMGCDPNHNDNYACIANELPRHSVYISAFKIDVYEVTNGQYAECVAAGACTAPKYNFSSTRYPYFTDPAYSYYPVIYVSWFNARDYCTWAGKRLPTEAEWEKAAKGTTSRAYPWGDTSPACTLANTWNDITSSYCVGDTSAVGSYPLGASQYGVMDMAGNVFEWVNDWIDDEYYHNSPTNNPTGPITGNARCLRGGCWIYGWGPQRVVYRNASPPDYRNPDLGFRCAAPPGN